MALDIDRADLDRCLPLPTPLAVQRPDPEPEDAALLWQLRGWEFENCLSYDDGRTVLDWLWNHDAPDGLRVLQLSWAHDISVWQVPDGERYVSFVHRPYYPRYRFTWGESRLVPLKAEPPAIEHRLFPAFTKYQVTLSAGHQGRMPRHLQPGLPEESFCPLCTRQANDWVLWPCAELRQYMPTWLVVKTEKRVRLHRAPAPADAAA